MIMFSGILIGETMMLMGRPPLSVGLRGRKPLDQRQRLLGGCSHRPDFPHENAERELQLQGANLHAQRNRTRRSPHQTKRPVHRRRRVRVGFLVPATSDVLLLHDTVRGVSDPTPDRHLLEQQTRSQPSVLLNLHRRAVPRRRTQNHIRPKRPRPHAVAKGF